MPRSCDLVIRKHVCATSDDDGRHQELCPDRFDCEHTFVTSDGSPIRRLRAALRAGDLLRVRGVAAELPYISLSDALLILELIETQDERGFEPAAVRWAGRLALEAPGLTLAQLHLAIEALDRLPD